jgi:N-acetylglutamate synthase-like GNAT family acetyltransferase
VDDGASRVIRPARLADAAAITDLLEELGYPDDVANVHARLQRLEKRADAEVLVAELDGRVAALAAYQLMDLLERRRPQCRITTLVVGANERRSGLARALILEVESIAREHRCFRLEVTTQGDRREAAEFYRAFGFHERPRRLVKPLGSD